MEYTYPAYFYDFQCVASECTDTCCAAWEIMIDPVSLKKYRKYPGFFGNRLKNPSTGNGNLLNSMQEDARS